MDRDELLKKMTADVARGVTGRYRREQSVPMAMWMDPEAILDSRTLNYDPVRPGAKIMVGALGDKLIGIADNRHILTVAGSRAGKSVTVVGNLLHYRGSVLAIDPKGELATRTAKAREAMGQRVVVLDPFGRAKGGAEEFRGAYNPLSRLDPESPTIIEDAGLVADGVVVANPEAKDPHWDESAHNFIEGLILHVVSSPLYQGGRTLNTVKRLIKTALTRAEKDEDFDFEVEAEMMLNAARLARVQKTRPLSEAIEAAARAFYDREDTEMAGVLSSIRRHTNFLAYGSMQNVLRSGDLDLADLKRIKGGLTIYLCLPALHMARCNRWLRIIINQLLEAMEKEEAVPEAPVLVCLDEFPTLGHMRQLENAAGQIAGFGVKLWVVMQDWGQGKALYKDRWESFAANAGILQFFGNVDPTTTKVVSEMLGKTGVEVLKEQEVGAQQAREGLKGVAYSVEQYDLLSPSEVAVQFSRDDPMKRQLIIWAGHDPMMLQRVNYYDPKGPLLKASIRAGSGA